MRTIHRTALILGLAYFAPVACDNGQQTSEASSAAGIQCHAHALNLVETGDYQFVFPDGISTYEEGTTIMQPRDGRIYRCKRFPYSNYCRQWSPVSTMFEPGLGSNWMAAWDPQ